MLFWWEEECQRLRKLDAEENELNAMISKLQLTLSQPGPNDADLHTQKQTLDQLKFARERVRMKKRQRPSQRHPDVEADRDDIVQAFHGRSKSVPTIANHDPRRLEDGESLILPSEGPPQYFANE